jgi:hypothetical protein
MVLRGIRNGSQWSVVSGWWPVDVFVGYDGERFKMMIERGDQSLELRSGTLADAQQSTTDH